MFGFPNRQDWTQREPAVPTAQGPPYVFTLIAPRLGTATRREPRRGRCSRCWSTAVNRHRANHCRLNRFHEMHQWRWARHGCVRCLRLAPRALRCCRMLAGRALSSRPIGFESDVVAHETPLTPATLGMLGSPQHAQGLQAGDTACFCSERAGVVRMARCCTGQRRGQPEKLLQAGRSDA